MILEGIVTTRNADGSINVAPMGPEVSEGEITSFVLKPFKTSETYQNLARHGEGVFHVIDNVLLMVEAMTGARQPELIPAKHVNGSRLADCCRYYEFKVTKLDDREDRTRIEAQVVHTGRVRDFFGFNRAKHAVVEAAILVSRLGLITRETIENELDRMMSPISKTGSTAEHHAFDLLRQQVKRESETSSRNRREVRVRAPSRLHFGFLSTPSPDVVRAYGGVGLMINEPAVEITGYACTAGTSPTIGPGSANISPGILKRVERIRNDVVSQLGLMPDEIPSIEIIYSPPEHVGLGVGTQLSLSVAKVISCCAGRSVCEAELAKLTGRGQRSSIGIHGWKSGGLTVDAGKTSPQETGPLVASHPFPTDWKVLVLLPSLAPGKHGEVEEKAIKTQVHIPAETTRLLSEIVLLRMLPAIVEKDIETFGLALANYNRLVGECFAPVQGGPYADPMIEAMIDWLGERNIGGAQSSWGPTTFAIIEGEENALLIGTELSSSFGLAPHQWRVTSVSNSGATFQP